jgi:hypothetical protein
VEKDAIEGETQNSRKSLLHAATIPLQSLRWINQNKDRNLKALRQNKRNVCLSIDYFLYWFYQKAKRGDAIISMRCGLFGANNGELEQSY